MHDNALHDLALACQSVLLSPIKRSANQTNLAYSGKLSAIGFETARYSSRGHARLRLRLLFFATGIEHCKSERYRSAGGEDRFSTLISSDSPLRCNGLFVQFMAPMFAAFCVSGNNAAAISVEIIEAQKQ